MPSLDRRPHRRFNPLLEEWVLCSPQRLERPWLGQTEDEIQDAVPTFDSDCALCPGNLRASGEKNPAYTGTYVFDNDFPALLKRTDPIVPERADGHGFDEGDELILARSETGVCRVVCFSPRHDLSLARMEVRAIEAVIDRWIEESKALAASAGISYVQIFENRGELMGCSNPHPHGQIWATEHVPTIPARKARTQEAYFRAHGNDLLGEYLARELRAEERIVCLNEAFVALVPFWAVWPFETLIVPRRHVGDLPSLTGDERPALADLMKRLTVHYDNLFRCSFPYSMGWHTRPADADHRGWRLHAVYLPPLLRSARVRKFLVGYEMTAEPQRDLTPEVAAARLRDVPERHYREI